MVSAVQGVLLKCDAPLKEYIRTIDEAQSPAEKFIIADVGAGGLLVKPSSVPFVAGKVKELRDQYQFERALAP